MSLKVRAILEKLERSSSQRDEKQPEGKNPVSTTTESISNLTPIARGNARAVLGIGTVITPHGDHMGELARPTEERIASKLDNLTAKDMPKKPAAETPFNHSYGGCSIGENKG